MLNHNRPLDDVFAEAAQKARILGHELKELPQSIRLTRTHDAMHRIARVSHHWPVSPAARWVMIRICRETVFDILADRETAAE